ncbi:MAG: nitroreductase family protein [Candidatus Aminicenantes bacterium]|nr:nitroreductase family protein [Candidatus Aminicenantes bacterium]
MDLPVSSWHQAVFFRKSRRSFLPGRPVAEDQFERLEFLSRAFRPFPEARFEIVREPPDHVLRGVIGSYGRISGAPAFAVMIGTSSSPAAAAFVGYTGEGLILEATALGLGTCWVSGMFRRSEVEKRVVLSGFERVFAVTPLGLGERDFSFKEKLYVRAAGSKKRKVLDEMTQGTSPLPWQKKALEAARAAPSAGNRQPWRFALTPGSITVRWDSGRNGVRYPKSLDCGIAMLHLELGARASGVAGSWEFLDPPAVARFDATG